MNQLDFKGKTAVVTGGMQGIGAAIVKRLEASGAKVATWDLEHSDKVDVANQASIQQALERTLRQLGRIDVLVNNAGIAGMTKPVVDYPVAEWKRVIDVDLNGPFLCCRAVVPHMVKAGYGRIVNIASIAGKEGNPNAAAYSSSKAAVIGLTKSLGKETAKNGITVNCVTPAAVKTPIFDQVPQSHIDYMLAKIPMGRFGLVEEIAATVVWACTEDCSFTTGSVFDLSGGRATY